MTFTPLKDRLDADELPTILAGPILRRTEPDSVTVWVALVSAKTVTLRIYSAETGELVENFSGVAPTVQLGKNLHIVAVTASPVEGVGAPLSWGEQYHYNLFFTTWEENPTEPAAVDQPDLRTPSILTKNAAPTLEERLLYDDPVPLKLSSNFPSFVLPPSELSELRVIHASCRKPHGDGSDMLPHLDTLIEESFADAELNRPQQLFLTGDQIYADDVDGSLMHMLVDSSTALLDWQEELFTGNVGDADNKPTVTPEQLEIGERDDLIVDHTGFTATVGLGDATAANHLIKLGEFYAMYLFAWSPVIWPPETETEVSGGVKGFFARLAKVRRALANTPTYMMFDDHDITDDWYLHRKWCASTLKTRLGRRIQLNGLLAFALFQAWGNTPQRFKESVGNAFLGQVKRIPAVDGTIAPYTEAEYGQLYETLGFPDLAKLEADKFLRPTSEQSLHWHYEVQGKDHQVIVLDTRTWRWFPDKEKDPPVLLGELNEAFNVANRKQIANASPNTQILFLISPGPVINIDWVVDLRRFFDWAWYIGSLGISDRGAADLEDWQLVDRAVPDLFEHLAEAGHKRGIILSGDVHYGYAARVEYENSDSGNSAVFSQFTASSLKNQDFKTKHVHDRGYAWWGGWLPDPEDYKHPDKPQQRYRVQYIADESITAPPAVVGQPASAAEWLGQQKDKAALFAKNWIELSDGTEAVGYNNIGEISFDSQNNLAIQKLWWHEDGKQSKDLKSTEYQVTLPIPG